jgi:hypothetical protein
VQHSDQPNHELSRARDAAQKMAAAASLDEYEEHWKEFLRRLERCWNKAQAHYGKSPKWNGWQGRIDKLRRTDPLLSYLVNARGAEEHTVSEITTRHPGGIGINPAEGNSLYIEHMEVKDGTISIRSPQKIRIDFIPDRIGLLPVSNRGRTYGIPGSHLGSGIDPRNVQAIANVALSFYEQVLREAEAFFVK